MVEALHLAEARRILARARPWRFSVLRMLTARLATDSLEVVAKLPLGHSSFESSILVTERRDAPWGKARQNSSRRSDGAVMAQTLLSLLVRVPPARHLAGGPVRRKQRFQRKGKDHEYRNASPDCCIGPSFRWRRILLEPGARVREFLLVRIREPFSRLFLRRNSALEMKLAGAWVRHPEYGCR